MFKPAWMKSLALLLLIHILRSHIDGMHPHPTPYQSVKTKVGAAYIT